MCRLYYFVQLQYNKIRMYWGIYDKNHFKSFPFLSFGTDLYLMFSKACFGYLMRLKFGFTLCRVNLSHHHAHRASSGHLAGSYGGGQGGTPAASRAVLPGCSPGLVGVGRVGREGGRVNPVDKSGRVSPSSNIYFVYVYVYCRSG